MAEMICKEKRTPTGKSVLLFSGGMDSICMNHLLNPDILLHIHIGSMYSNKEYRKIDRMCEMGLLPKKKLINLTSTIHLADYERSDAMIPCRNALLVLLAAQYGETIYLGSVDGDRSSDKDYAFFMLMGELLDHMFQEAHWTHKHTFKANAPFKHLTKTELVKLYVEQGGEHYPLQRSVSCYDKADGHCGWCKPCFRKWVALINNDVSTETIFKQDPWEAPWLPELLPLIEKDEYRGKEDKDIRQALEMVK